MSEVRPAVVERVEPLWFLGTLARVLIDGAATGGRFALIDLTLPEGASPPVHSHPQDETFHILEGEMTVWVDGARHSCAAGTVVFAPAGHPHSFRVGSDTARIVILSTPAGIEDYFRALGEPARWPWLQPPADGPRVPAARIEEVERTLGIVRHGPPPPE